MEELLEVVVYVTLVKPCNRSILDLLSLNNVHRDENIVQRAMNVVFLIFVQTVKRREPLGLARHLTL